jgi:acyl carrier protein
MTKTVEETIKEIASQILHKSDLNFAGGATFKDIGADSLDVVQMMVKIEDTYNIELIDEEMQSIASVKDFVAYIERKIAAKG